MELSLRDESGDGAIKVALSTGEKVHQPQPSEPLLYGNNWAALEWIDSNYVHVLQI